jgi:hypothetical protein
MISTTENDATTREIDNGTSNVHPEMRTLRNEELDAVSGGFYDDGGCIRLPKILVPWIQPKPWHFVDPFTKPGL